MIIVNKDMRTSILCVMYSNALDKTLERINNDSLKSDKKLLEENISSLLFYGIKKYGVSQYMNKNKNLEELEHEFIQMDVLIGLIGVVTPRIFMNIFPIAKEYKGKKNGCKDYFTTMDYIQSIGIDSIIESPEDFLWAYHNDEITNFVVNQLMIASSIRKIEKGSGIAEEWAIANNVETIKTNSENSISFNDRISNFEILNKEQG